jgi:uncharacterized protein YktB (UPF0637 family)
MSLFVVLLFVSFGSHYVSRDRAVIQDKLNKKLVQIYKELKSAVVSLKNEMKMESETRRLSNHNSLFHSSVRENEKRKSELLYTSAIQRLRNSSVSNDICPICLESLADRNTCHAQFPCGHKCHLGCSSMLRRSNAIKCPLCRRNCTTVPESVS